MSVNQALLLMRWKMFELGSVTLTQTEDQLTRVRVERHDQMISRDPRLEGEDVQPWKLGS